jgi:hypothetical protein
MALKELLTDLSNFNWNYENAGVNTSKKGGRHGGYEGGGEPPHPEEHSKFDDKSGVNLSQIKGRHGGTEGPTPAQPPHPDDHSIHDDGVGRGVYPSDNPQSFNVRGYTVTGNKRFYIGWQGDIMNHSLSDYGIGAFDSIAGVFDHTQTRDRLRKAYSNYPEITFGADIDGGINGLNGSIHIGNQDLPEVIGGGVSYYGNLNPINPRGSVFRDSSGNYQVPQEGRNTNPPGGISNIPLFEGTKPESGFDRSLMYIPNIIEPSDSVFKEFSRSDSSLIRIDRYSDNFDMNNSQFFEFPDTRPYDLIFKGVTPWAPMWVSDPVTGVKSNIDVTLDSTQPYIVREIGDRWGLYEGDTEDGGEHLSGAIEWANALSGEFLRAPLDVMIDRSVADIGRIAKFLTSTKGALFLGKQFILQAFNPTIETKVYNPLSLGSVVPMIHVNRHAGGKRYTDVVPSDKAIEAVGDLMPDVSVGPVTIGGNDIINAAFNAAGVEQPSFGRVEMQSPLATVSGQKLPLDKRVALSNPNRYLWPGPMGVFVKTGTDAAIADASRIESSQGRVLKRAKEQSGGGVPDLFQKHSFNKYSGENVYLDGKGILFVPASASPFGTLASIPISVSQATTMATDALTNWGNSLIGGDNTKKSDFTPPSRGVDLESPLQKVIDEDVFSATDVAVNRDKEVFGGDHWGPDRPGGIYEQFAFDAIGDGDRKTVQIGTIPNSVITVKTHSNNQPGESIKPVGGVIVIPQYSLTKDMAKPFQTPILRTGIFEGNIYDPHDAFTINNYFPNHGSLITDSTGNYLTLSIGDGVHLGPAHYITGEKYPQARPTQFYKIPGDTVEPIVVKPFATDGATSTWGGITRGDRIFDDSFVGNLYKYDKEGKSDGGAYYWHKDKGLITNETYLTISSGESVHAKNNLPSAEKIIFYGDAPGTRIGYGLDKITLGDRIKVDNGFQGDLYGPFRNTALTKQGKDKYFDSTGRVPSEPLVAEGDDPIYLGYAGSIGTKTTTIHNFGLHTHGSEVIGITDFDPSSGDKRPSKIFGTEKHNRTRVSKTVYHFGGNIYSFDGSSYLKRLKNRFEFKGQLGHYGDIGELPTGGTGAKLTKFVSVGWGTDFQGDIFSYKDKDGVSTTVFDKDLYNGTDTYLKELNKKSRVGTDTVGDPIVTIKTKHTKSSARIQTAGVDTLKEPIKLQNFPLLNQQGSGNIGTEGQSLSFVDSSKEPIKLSDSLYGPDDKISTKVGDDYDRKGFTKESYQESIKGNVGSEGGTTDVVVNKGRFSVNESNIPQAVKRLSTLNSNMDAANLVLGNNDVTVDFPVDTRTDSKTVGTGNILDRYKTLAYGAIPKNGVDENRYDKQDLGKNKSPVTTHTTSLSTVKIVSDPDLGLIKKTSDDDKYATDLTDSVNMHPYGDSGEVDDYIKFKIYDIVNKKYIIFRAFLSGVSETLSPEWSSEKYIGRPDSVHVYQGVDRSMSFEFMIVPSSKQELPLLWEKLNYLVGLTYPTWKALGTTGKRMEAPFIQLTIGDMYNTVPGYFSSLSITVDDQSPWELDQGFQLPHAITVGCEFTHIGQHALASQGTHFDFGGQDKTFLKPYDAKTATLGARKQLTGLMGT